LEGKLNKIQKKLLEDLLKKERNRKIQRAKMSFGRKFEYKVKRRFEDKGYVVFRLAGSKPFDLIAINPNNHEILIIECKTNNYYPKYQMKKQIQIAKKLNAKLILAVKNKRTKYTQIYP